MGDLIGQAEEKSKQVLKESLEKINRVYVAVHGIGDQGRFETIQRVTHQVGKFFGAPAAVPLGGFHSSVIEEAGFHFLSPPYSTQLLEFGFAEIYWADIPREVQEEGHSLEESKKWASTLVSRIRMRAEGGQTSLSKNDYEMIEKVVGEMIEGVAVLDRLLLLANKMGLFKFELKELLDSFLGDVQVVTEFESRRVELLERFHTVMAKVRKANPKLDIYIVAHSEGTVVAFLALLKAFKEYTPETESQYGWIKQVRGLMTIGSPIEEHLILWPELWKEFLRENGTTPNEGPLPPTRCLPETGKRIVWWNYLDRGDPIAYQFHATGRWVRDNGWDRVFDLGEIEADGRPAHEVVFNRYPFPGKAHNDYWDDHHVFGHFIKNVVHDGGGTLGAQFSKKPSDIRGIGLLTRLVPYLLPALLLITAVWIMTRGVHGFLYPDGWRYRAGTQVERVGSMANLSRDVAGISMLLMGITVAARVPRLTRSWGALLVAFGVFLTGAAVYPLVATQGAREFLAPFDQPDPPAPAADVPSGKVASGASSPFMARADHWAREMAGRYTGANLGLIGIAALLVAGVMWFSSAWPGGGAKPLILLGFALIVYILIQGIIYADVQRFDVRLMAWRDGAGVPTSGSYLVIVGTDDKNLLHIRTFDAGGHFEDTDETRLPASQAAAIATLKQQLPGLSPPHELNDAEKAKVIGEAASIVSLTPERGPLWPVFVAGAAFFYLWWLAVVLFDLIYVWHHYIRGSIWGETMATRLDELCEDRPAPATARA